MQHLSYLRETLGARARAMAAALNAELGTSLAPPGGGYFVWLDLGEGCDTQELLASCRAEYGVAFTAGARCAIERDLSSCLRLSFSFYEVAEIERGVRALAQALRR